MREFIIRHLEDGTSNAMFHYARLFNDGVVALPARLDHLRICNLDHGFMKAYQLVRGTVKLPPKGGQLHIPLLERSIRKEKLRHESRSPLKLVCVPKGAFSGSGSCIRFDGANVEMFATGGRLE